MPQVRDFTESRERTFADANPRGIQIRNLQFLDTLNSRGTVFLARCQDTGRILVARRLPRKQTVPYEKLLCAGVPHVPQVRKLAEDGPDAYLVLEDYIPGVTLERYLRLHGPDAGLAVRVGEQLCGVLSALHGLGIVHRDIKPSNVILTEDGQAWLIDFDISRQQRPEQVRDTQILGTCGYAAPEQFGFSQTDGRTDIYSLGVLMNAVAAGALPQQRLAEGRVGTVIRRCISIDPADRYADAEELRRELAGLLPGQKRRRKGTQSGKRARDGGGGEHSVPWNLLKRIPGFRSGNPLYAFLALSFYCAAGFFSLGIFLCMFREPVDFCIGMGLLLGIWGCYAFVFDLFQIRTRCLPVERRRGERLYGLYCASAMGIWVLFLLMFMVVSVGLLNRPELSQR